MRLIRANQFRSPLVALLLLGLTVPLSVKSFLFPSPSHHQQSKAISFQNPPNSLHRNNVDAVAPQTECLLQQQRTATPVLLAQQWGMDENRTPRRSKRERVRAVVRKIKKASVSFVALFADKVDSRKSKGSKRERVRAVARQIKKASIPLAASLTFWLGAQSLPAQAKEAFDIPTTSISRLNVRAGTTNVDEITQVKGGGIEQLKGETLVAYQNQDTVTSSSEGNAVTTQHDKKQTKRAKNSVYGDIEDDDFEDDDFGDLEQKEFPSTTTDNKFTQAELDRARMMQTNTAHEQFIAYRKKDPYLKLKVGAAVFIPTFGGQSLREHFRQKKEKKYVKKGLEIMRAQEAEYFNITNTAADSDVEDELKGLKNKDGDDDDDDEDDSDDEDYDDEDDDDDDDDDDDSDDEDDDDEGDRRRRPKRPTRGGGPSGDGGKSGGGGDYDPGYGKPSDEDTERLKNLFNKS